ncbi:hypothetical protein [Gordonia sp. DT218]
MATQQIAAPGDVKADDTLVFTFSTTFQPDPGSNALRSQRRTVIGYADLPGLQIEFYEQVDGFGSEADMTSFNRLISSAVRQASTVQ